MDGVKPRVRLEVRSIFSVRTVDERNDMLENIKIERTTGQFKKFTETAQEQPTTVGTLLVGAEMRYRRLTDGHLWWWMER
jgi:hypothetical protein